MNIRASLLLLNLVISTGWSPCLLAETTNVQLSREQTIRLKVQNMTCALCTLTIKKALQDVDGVEQVGVDYASKTATIRFDSARTNIDSLIKATTSAGYPATVEPVSR